MASYIDKIGSTPEGARSLRQEEFILEVTEQICKLMKHEGISRQKLAERMGKSKGRISQLLDGEANLTLRTLSDIFAALGHKVVVDFERTSHRRSSRFVLTRTPISTASSSESMHG